MLIYPIILIVCLKWKEKEFEEEARYYIIVLREGSQMNRHVENVSLMESGEAQRFRY